MVNGLTPGQFYPAGSLYPQGLSFGTPRNWSQGGMQQYDPRYVKPLTTEGMTARTGSRAFDGARPGAGVGMPGGQDNGRANMFGGGMAAPQSGGINVQTGITAGPVLPQNIVQAEQNRLRGYQAQMPPGAQYAPFMQQLNDLVGGQLNTAATDFGRDAAYANAQQLLASQRAQAGAGAGWGNAMLGDYASRMGSQGQSLNAILALLRQFMV